MQKKIGLIITVRFRQKTLPRCLSYYSKFNDIKIVIIDASEKKYNGPFFSDSIIYIHKPNLHPTNFICLAIEQEFTDIEYICLYSDDDIILIPSLIECAEFLDNHSEYVAIEGHGAALYDHHIAYETMEYVLGKYLQCPENRLERIEFAWNYFSAINHSLIRKKTQYNAYKFMIENPDLWAIRFWDKILGLIVANDGLFGRNDTFFQLRSLESKTGHMIHYPEANEAFRSHLDFKKDFLNRDLSKLEKLLKCDRQFLEKIYNNFASMKNIIFNELTTKIAIRCPNFKIDNYNITYQYPNKIDKLNNALNPSSIFPIYNTKYQKEIYHILQSIKEYPL